MEKNLTDGSIRYTGTELADLLGVSRQRLSKAARDGSDVKGLAIDRFAEWDEKEEQVIAYILPKSFLATLVNRPVNQLVNQGVNQAVNHPVNHPVKAVNTAEQPIMAGLLGMVPALVQSASGSSSEILKILADDKKYTLELAEQDRRATEGRYEKTLDRATTRHEKEVELMERRFEKAEDRAKSEKERIQMLLTERERETANLKSSLQVEKSERQILEMRHEMTLMDVRHQHQLEMLQTQDSSVGERLILAVMNPETINGWLKLISQFSGGNTSFLPPAPQPSITSSGNGSVPNTSAPQPPQVSLAQEAFEGLIEALPQSAQEAQMIIDSYRNELSAQQWLNIVKSLIAYYRKRKIQHGRVATWLEPLKSMIPKAFQNIPVSDIIAFLTSDGSYSAADLKYLEGVLEKLMAQSDE